jgi:hypothetical protein
VEMLTLIFRISEPRCMFIDSLSRAHRQTTDDSTRKGMSHLLGAQTPTSVALGIRYVLALISRLFPRAELLELGCLLGIQDPSDLVV